MCDEATASPPCEEPRTPGDGASHRMDLRVQNGFSVDVEDWYQGFPSIPPASWTDYECRLAVGLERTLDLLAEFGTIATFFILGYNAERYPHLVRMIDQQGHELATHGYDHCSLFQQSPKQFRDQLRRSTDAIENASGTRVVGHRAPYFSMAQTTQWALDILIEEGFTYDSSIYGTTDAPVGHASAHGNSGPRPPRSSMIMVMNASAS